MRDLTRLKKKLVENSSCRSELLQKISSLTGEQDNSLFLNEKQKEVLKTQVSTAVITITE